MPAPMATIFFRAPHLKVVGRAGVALENIDVLACRARGVDPARTFRELVERYSMCCTWSAAARS